jgi:hypothetical protein
MSQCTVTHGVKGPVHIGVTARAARVFQMQLILDDIVHQIIHVIIVLDPMMNNTATSMVVLMLFHGSSLQDLLRIAFVGHARRHWNVNHRCGGTIERLVLHVNFRSHGKQGLCRQGLDLIIDVVILWYGARRGMVQVRVQMGRFFPTKTRFRRTPMLATLIKAIGETQCIVVTVTVKAQFLCILLRGLKGPRHTIRVKNNHIGIVANQSDTLWWEIRGNRDNRLGVGNRMMMILSMMMMINIIIIMMMMLVITIIITFVVIMMILMLVILMRRLCIAMTSARRRRRR